MRILLVDTHRATQNTVKQLFPEYIVDVVTNAESAILAANSAPPDIVLLELSLRGHSGMEFLYEFRTYTDWASIPVIIYSTIVLDKKVLQSKAWDKLGIASYLYKPETSLSLLRSSVEKVCSIRETA